MPTPLRAIAGALLATAILLPAALEAQGFGDRLKRKAQERIDKAKEAAAEKTVDAGEAAVRCAVSDKACQDKAKAEGKRVETTDAEGNVVPAGAAKAGASAAASASASADAAPAKRLGAGAWANYDFIPGTRPVFVDDFTRDQVGDFPRRMEFREGALEIVEWEGARYLRASAQSRWALELPEVLPSRFTMEFDYGGHVSNEVWISFGDDEQVRVEFRNDGAAEVYNAAGGPGGKAINATGSYSSEQRGDVVRRARILADGKYVKVYVDDKRLLNVPNAALPRGNRIHFNTDGREEEPSFFGNFSVMAGGRRLYDDLASAGRVATQGIYFDTGSDRIRPESTPTLKEIAAMLAEHGTLRLLIEGHTDDVGGAAANLALSERRAAAVKAALVADFSADGARLATMGMGQAKPAAPNTTAEGRRQNRRVELVRQ